MELEIGMLKSHYMKISYYTSISWFILFICINICDH